MREITSDQLVSAALTAVAELYGVKKAWKLPDGREAIFIPALRTFGVSKGKQIGDGVQWIKKPMPPLKTAF